MKPQRNPINQLLTDVYHSLLKTGQSSITSDFSDLNINEMHVIEIVCAAEEGDNRASSIAETLHITAGTLTTTVKCLEKKGYLIRRRDDKDQRIVRIYATEAGKRANEEHEAFHEEMVEDVLADLTEEETNAFLRGLRNVTKFFSEKLGSSKKE